MADNTHSEFKHGSMDIRAQEKTFAGFIHWVMWSVGIIFLALIVLALAGA